jgi:hypothetical protein
MQIQPPVPFPELRCAFAALSARASEIGALVLGGMLDYFLHRRLERMLAALIAKVRLALLHCAFDLVPVVRSYVRRPDPPFVEPPPYAEEETEAPSPTEPRAPPRSSIVLWPVGRTGHDNSAGRQPYYWVPDEVCTRRLIGRFAAVAHILANPTIYARKLALILTRPPRCARRNPEFVSLEEPDRVDGRHTPEDLSVQVASESAPAPNARPPPDEA